MSRDCPAGAEPRVMSRDCPAGAELETRRMSIQRVLKPKKGEAAQPGVAGAHTGSTAKQTNARQQRQTKA
eukprot:335683-Chlamydomonas_euryale.AAC.1